MAEEAAMFTWPLDNQAYQLLDGVRADSVLDFQWIVILGGILAFAMAWGIGANDVANAFATSVGAGSLSLKWACVIAAVFEFSGALLMGSTVTDTVRKNIINLDVFDPVRSDGSSNGPEILMTGFLVALISATSWLIIATYLSLPVSTTHSIIGSLVGVGFAYRGPSAVVWISDGARFKKLNGVVGVFLSWVISPVLSGIFAIIVFLVVRTAVLRSKNPVRNGFLYMPFFYMFTVSVTLFFIIYKGSLRFKLDKKFLVGQAIGIALGGGVGAALLAWWFVIPQARAYLDRWEKREIEKLHNLEAAEEKGEDKVNSALEKVGINLEVNEELDDDVIQMHDIVEKFDPKAEQLFTWLQIFTAAFDAFAHGANDVANSVAPFASIYSLYQSNGAISKVSNDSEFEGDGKYVGGKLDGKPFSKGDKVPDGKSFCGSIGDTDYVACQIVFPNLSPGADENSTEFSLYDSDGKLTEESKTCYSKCAPGGAVKYKSQDQSVELWILALGGFGIVAGLAMWGYRIIVAIGVKLTKLTPSRGFSIELGAAITVIIASRIGLPVSTTHCQVGATMGVGLVEFKRGAVNWKQFLYICAGWVFTVVFTALVAAGIFSLLTNAPMELLQKQSYPPLHCPGQNMFVFDPIAQGFRGVGCSGVEK